MYTTNWAETATTAGSPRGRGPNRNPFEGGDAPRRYSFSAVGADVHPSTPRLHRRHRARELSPMPAGDQSHPRTAPRHRTVRPPRRMPDPRRGPHRSPVLRLAGDHRREPNARSKARSTSISCAASRRRSPPRAECQIQGEEHIDPLLAGLAGPVVGRSGADLDARCVGVDTSLPAGTPACSACPPPFVRRCGCGRAVHGAGARQSPRAAVYVPCCSGCGRAVHGAGAGGDADGRLWGIENTCAVFSEQML